MQNNGNGNFKNQQQFNGNMGQQNSNYNGGMQPPNYNYYQKPKKPWYKRWWMIVIYVLVGLCILGSIGGNDNSSSNKTATNADNEVKDIYSVGEEVTMNDHTLILNSVEVSQGDEYDRPKDGMEYVIVNVTIKNSGNDTINYNVFDFKMENSQGNITQECFSTVDTDTALNSGELSSGGSVTGTIVFEQPIDDENLVLIYQSNIFSDKTIKIKAEV